MVPSKEVDGAGAGDLVPSKEVDGAGDLVPSQEVDGAGELVPSQEVDGAGGVALKEGEGEGEGDAAIDELLSLHLDLSRLRNPVSREGSGLLVLPKL